MTVSYIGSFFKLYFIGIFGDGYVLKLMSRAFHTSALQPRLFCVSVLLGKGSEKDYELITE